VIALFACTLWLCAPVPLVSGLPSLAACRAAAAPLAVAGVTYRCRAAP